MGGVKEEWRDVPKWEGFYQVSDLGRVRSVDRVVQLSNRKCRYKGRLLRQKKIGLPGKDYWTVVFSRPGMRSPKNFKVHLLVLCAFVGPRPSPKHQGCHNDGDRFNNHYTNLRWGTPKENCADTIKHGRTTRGEKNTQATLTTSQVRAIRNDQRTQTVIAKDYGVSQTCVSKIKTRLRWGHIA